MAAPDHLFHSDPLKRLIAARTLPLKTLNELQTACSKEAPVRPWPYGMPTVLNPWILFLGPSPGAPGPGDPSAGTEEPYPLPTLGCAHPKIYHPARYFTQIREAAQIIIRQQRPELLDRDCHALLGNVNLSTRQDGQAVRSGVEPACGEWIPRLIFERFRPRVVVLLGLLGFMARPENSALFDPNRVLRLDWKRPDSIRPFHAYTTQSLAFRIWERNDSAGQPVTLVAWPNHPSRVPFKQPALWTAAAREFGEWMAAG